METLLKYNYVLRDTNARPKIEQCTIYSCQRKHFYAIDGSKFFFIPS